MVTSRQVADWVLHATAEATERRKEQVEMAKTVIFAAQDQLVPRPETRHQKQ